MLNWLEPLHLDVPLDLHKQQVQDEIIKGQQGTVGVASPGPRHNILLGFSHVTNCL